MTSNPVSMCALTNSITLSTTPQDIFTTAITNGLIFISMSETGVDIGGVQIIIGGGVARNIAYSGQMYNSASSDLVLLPFTYGGISNSNTYTIMFDYDNSTSRLRASIAIGEPTVTVTFTATIMSTTDFFANNKLAIAQIAESATNAGTQFLNGVSFAGPVTFSSTVDISTPVTGSLSFTGSGAHSWSSTSGTVTRIGKMCYVNVIGTITANGILLGARSTRSFFSITPTNDFKTTNSIIGIAADGTGAVGYVVNIAGTATFSIVLPTAILIGGSTTIMATFSYMAI